MLSSPSSYLGLVGSIAYKGHLFIPRRPEKTHLFIPRRPEKTPEKTRKDIFIVDVSEWKMTRVMLIVFEHK